MLLEPKCWTRHCTHFTGVIQPDGSEESEVNACEAFPNGIPDEIAYGDDLHLDVKPNQVGEFVFTPEQ